ncbi:hypothetical protein ER308_12525 [Egibacter rhizosphaerae]|uniref:Bacterial sugar transferase domain-containing protein n=1 Tax=Egibacter rhizosphaerae TaxID=1670831 RepID=A0A411YGK6_9ACTN|nr:hypothetical protein [Egibacter rhizosphaerae]QBI20307.1 hypothetical protein ER308_12525 [Egibacter rhizosphaerae]
MSGTSRDPRAGTLVLVDEPVASAPVPVSVRAAAIGALVLLAPALGVLVALVRLTVGTPITVDRSAGTRFRTEPPPTARRHRHLLARRLRHWHLDELPTLWDLARGRVVPFTDPPSATPTPLAPVTVGTR